MLSKDSTKEVLCDKSMELKNIGSICEKMNCKKKEEKKAMVLCYSTGSREILGYIPLVLGRAAK